jgi:hypothetical protein
LMEVSERVGCGKFPGPAEPGAGDEGVSPGNLVNQGWRRGDEAVPGDLFTADDTFQQKCVRITTQNLERPNWRKAVGQQLPINRDDVRVFGRGKEAVEIGEVPPHERNCSDQGEER